MLVKKSFFLIIFITLTLKIVYGAEIFSIEPFEIHPESVVTIKGTDFTNETVVLLGNKIIKPFSLTNEQLKFIIPPNFEPGTYRLILKNKEMATFPLSLLITRREVQIFGYTPETFDFCSKDKELTVTGKNLKEIKKISTNGVDIQFFPEESNIVLKLPAEILERNNELNILFFGKNDKIVHVINIPINKKPFIEDIKNVSSDFNSATYIIQGKNFIKNLSLYVNNQIITEYKDPLSQQNITFLPRRSQNSDNVSSPLLDRLQFNSCNELIYIRYPATPDNKKLDIYIENPNGEKSNTFTIFVP